jgi:hypothetical protein
MTVFEPRAPCGFRLALSLDSGPRRTFGDGPLRATLSQSQVETNKRRLGRTKKLQSAIQPIEEAQGRFSGLYRGDAMVPPENLLCDYDVEALRKEIVGDINLGKIHSPVVCDTARIDDWPTAGRNLKYLERIERQRS